MYYHYAILLLFQPFIKVDILRSGISPREVCSQAAQAISALVNSYSQLYTLRRTPSFVPYFVLASSIAHLVTVGNSRSGPELLLQSATDLKEMTSCHGFAICALDIIYFLSRHWAIDVTFNEENEERDPKSICLPSADSMNQFCPNIASTDLVNGIGPVGENENPLFWTFPLQGRPVMQPGNLFKAGFKILES